MKYFWRVAIKRIIFLLASSISFTQGITLSTPAYAAESAVKQGFNIISASTKLVNQVYQLSADIEYNFSEEVLSAIQNGVPIIIVIDVEIHQHRSYVWDKLFADLKQRFTLQYHALSEQYIVKNINSGAQETYPTLHTALNNLRELKSLPVIDKNLLIKDENYTGRARVRIELETLPVPLRLNAYITRSWWLGSDWYEWEL